MHGEYTHEVIFGVTLRWRVSIDRELSSCLTFEFLNLKTLTIYYLKTFVEGINIDMLPTNKQPKATHDPH